MDVKSLRDETHETEDRRIYEMYLSQAGVILAKVQQDQGIGNDINRMEHIFGNTWLTDGMAHTKAYSTWDKFKELLLQSIHGMTVNERLFALGLLDEFDKAIERRSEDRMRAVLSKCFLTQDNIQTIIDQQLKRKK